MAPAQQHMTTKQWLMLVGLACLWGSSFLFTKMALTGLPPMVIVALRMSLGAVALYGYMKIAGVPWPGMAGENRRAVWRALFFIGIFNNIIPLTLIVWGQVYIASSLAAILNSTVPLFTVLMAHFFTEDEKMTPARVLGVLIGFAGVVTVVGPANLLKLSEGIWGQLAILGAASCFGTAAVASRRFARLGMRPIQMSGGQVLAGAVMIWPIAFLAGDPLGLPMPEARVWVGIAGLGLLSTAFAYLLFFRLIGEAGATNASLVTLVVPAVAIFNGVLFLGERLKAVHFVGLGSIVLGLVVIDGRFVRWLKQRSARR